MRSSAAALLLASVLFSPGIARASDKEECIAAFESAQRLRADGSLTRAISQFAICARGVCPPSLQKQCVDEAGASSALLPTVVLSAVDGSHKSVVDVTVTVDGAVVATVLDGKAIPMDPGLHAFRFETAGALPFERRIAVNEGQKGQLVAVELTAIEAAVQAPIATDTAAPTPREPTQSKSVDDRARTVRWVGVGIGAGGLVGIALGSAFGSMAFQKWSDAKAECGASCGAGSAAYASESTGRTYATVSTTAFVAGGAAIVGGTILFLLAPSTRSSARASLTPTFGGVELSGTF